MICGGLLTAQENNKISEFLFTDPRGVIFKKADNYLPKPFSSKIEKGVPWGDGNRHYNRIWSNVDIESGSFQYNILQDKKGHFFYGMSMQSPKSCDVFIELIKNAYDEDFIYNAHDNVTVFGNSGKYLEGSIDVKNWRVRLSCYEEGDFFMASMMSGEKKFVDPVEKRQDIDCTMESGMNLNYQIDNRLKILFQNNVSAGDTLLFNNDFIKAARKDLTIMIDRKSGKITITSMDESARIYGFCEKRGDKKF